MSEKVGKSNLDVFSETVIEMADRAIVINIGRFKNRLIILAPLIPRIYIYLDNSYRSDAAIKEKKSTNYTNIYEFHELILIFKSSKFLVSSSLCGKSFAKITKFLAIIA